MELCEDMREHLAFRAWRKGVGREWPGRRSSLGREEQDKDKYDKARCRHGSIKRILYYALRFRLRATLLAIAVCAALCAS